MAAICVGKGQNADGIGSVGSRERAADGELLIAEQGGLASPRMAVGLSIKF